MTLLERVHAALAEPAATPLLTGDLVEGSAAPPVEAAVLIALTDRPEPGAILTLRREHLRTHAGQVAFPGGRLDPGEDS
ncbi:MAG: NUDIX domain-containing protein, partial [Sphingomicrobium sp.]